MIHLGWRGGGWRCRAVMCRCVGVTTNSTAQKRRDIEPMLFECWASVEDGGPAFNQHWFNVSFLFGRFRNENNNNLLIRQDCLKIVNHEKTTTKRVVFHKWHV